MIRSMTGYGRKEVEAEGIYLTIEIRSVNNRYIDVQVKVPTLAWSFGAAGQEGSAGTLLQGALRRFHQQERRARDSGQDRCG